MGGRGSRFQTVQPIADSIGTPSGLILADVQQMDDDGMHDFLIGVDKTDMPAFLSDLHLQKMVYALGMNDMPEIVSDSQMQTLIANGAIPLYRTVNDTTVTGIPFTAKDICDMLIEGDITYMGKGIHGDGLYFSDSLSGSKAYGNNTSKTMTAVFNNKARPILERTLKRQYDTFIKTHPRTRKALGFARSKSSHDSLSQFALLQGYNVILSGQGGGETYYTVLDRSILTMTKTLK